MYTTNASRGLPRHRSRYPAERYTRWALRGLVAALVLALLWLVLAFHLNGQPIFAVLFLVLGAALGVVFTRRTLMSHRYIFPAVASMALFVIFPLLYTVGISFSNYSSSNLLSEERVRAQLLSRTYQEESATFGFQLYSSDEGVRLYLSGRGLHPRLVKRKPSSRRRSRASRASSPGRCRCRTASVAMSPFSPPRESRWASRCPCAR